MIYFNHETAIKRASMQQLASFFMSGRTLDSNEQGKPGDRLWLQCERSKDDALHALDNILGEDWSKIPGEYRFAYLSNHCRDFITQIEAICRTCFEIGLRASFVLRANLVYDNEEEKENG